MGVESGQPSRVVAAYLDDTEAELAAFDALVAVGSRFAAFHLEQAAEKLIRAVRIHRQLVVTNTHDIVLLVDGHPGDPAREPRPLPDGDPWRARMREHEWL
jgi:HEPN domain